jgi:nicotinamide-nucleotide amidase
MSSHEVEILTVGDELLRGEIVDVNSSTIARRLLDVGLQVEMSVTVGDEKDEIINALREMARRSRVVMVTGGLGPTQDDRTAEAAAEAFGRRLILHEGALERIKTIFRKYGLELTPNNMKQAYVPEDAQVIINPVGTAPGFGFKEGGCLLVFLPGVPREVESMLGEVIERLVKPHCSPGTAVRSRMFRIFGMTESKIDQLMKGALDSLEGVSLASLPHYPENRLRVVARASTPQKAEELLLEAQRRIEERLGDCVYGFDDEELEVVVWRLLYESGRTLAVAESCTGGLIAHRITNVPGSSEVFLRGFVAYSPQAKVELLGVPPSVLEREGAVSATVAEAMARGARERAGADLAVASTGIAGPSGGTEDKPVGTVYLALADSNGAWSKRFLFRGERGQIKITASTAALDWLRLYLQGRNPQQYEIPWSWRGP